MRAKDGERESVVYLLGNADNRLVKIGMTTKSGLERLAGIQTMSPSILSILWSTPGGTRLEHKLHYQFRVERRHGEWFDFGDRDPIAEVSAAAAELAADEPEQARVSEPEGGSFRLPGELIEDLRDVANRLGNVLIEDPVRTAAELANHLDQLHWVISSLRIAMGMLQGSFDESGPTWPAGSDAAQVARRQLDLVRTDLDAAGFELRYAFENLMGSGAVLSPHWCGECSDERARQVALADGRVGRCPTCHPLRPQQTTNGYQPYRNPPDQSVYDSWTRI